VPKKHIIIFGVLCVVALGLGYWSGPFKKDSGQRAEGGSTNIVTVQPSVKAEFNPIIEKEIRRILKKPTGELTKTDLEKVTRLDLLSRNLTDVKGLENLTQLTTLYLHANQLTEVPKGLEKLTQLRFLELHYNQLTDVQGLEKLNHLTYLNLQNNPALTKAQIDELKKALPKCDIRSNPKK